MSSDMNPEQNRRRQRLNVQRDRGPNLVYSVFIWGPLSGGTSRTPRSWDNSDGTGQGKKSLTNTLKTYITGPQNRHESPFSSFPLVI